MKPHLVHHKGLACRTVLIDTWYAAKEVMLFIESQGKIYYCAIKSNRLVDDAHSELDYRHIDSLEWNEREVAHGKIIKISGFPKEHKVKLFRVTVFTHRTDMVVTNDLTQDLTKAAQQTCALRGKIEPFHRETKQFTGIKRWQCPKARIHRNHITYAHLVWMRLATITKQTAEILSRIKYGLLDEFLRQQLKTIRLA